MKTEWIRTLGTLTNGVYVLTTTFDGKINGMIASWVSQVSYEPPLIAVAVHENRLSHGLLRQSGLFVLHVLGTHQKEMVTRFMGSDPETKFDGIKWQPGQTGCPLLADCVASFECRVKTSIRPGNHTLFIGEVVNATLHSDAEPLSTRDVNGQYIGKA
ncbi:MAG: flavin reductase family protein [Desulfobacterales bacterium]